MNELDEIETKLYKITGKISPKMNSNKARIVQKFWAAWFEFKNVIKGG